MELASVKGWNYFLDVKKINPSMQTPHFKKQKGILRFFRQEMLKSPFPRQNFFLHYYMPRKKSITEKRVSGE